MESVFVTPAVAADAAAVADLIAALESSLCGRSAFSQADLMDEWSDVDRTPVSSALVTGLLVMARSVSVASAGTPRGMFTPMRSGGGSGS